MNLFGNYNYFSDPEKPRRKKRKSSFGDGGFSIQSESSSGQVSKNEGWSIYEADQPFEIKEEKTLDPNRKYDDYCNMPKDRWGNPIDSQMRTKKMCPTDRYGRDQSDINYAKPLMGTSSDQSQGKTILAEPSDGELRGMGVHNPGQYRAMHHDLGWGFDDEPTFQDLPNYVNKDLHYALFPEDNPENREPMVVTSYEGTYEEETEGTEHRDNKHRRKMFPLPGDPTFEGHETVGGGSVPDDWGDDDWEEDDWEKDDEEDDEDESVNEGDDEGGDQEGQPVPGEKEDEEKPDDEKPPPQHEPDPDPPESKPSDKNDGWDWNDPEKPSSKGEWDREPPVDEPPAGKPSSKPAPSDDVPPGSVEVEPEPGMRPGTRKIQHPDGADEYVMTNGHTFVARPDGGFEFGTPEGRYTVFHPDGRREVIEPEPLPDDFFVRQNPQEVYDSQGELNSNGATPPYVGIPPDSIELQAPSQLPAGTRRFQYPDGREEVVMPSGNRFVVWPDHVVSVYTPTGDVHSDALEYYNDPPDPDRINIPQSPPGVDLDQNVLEAGNHSNPWWFYEQVRNKGPKDYKQQGRQYENYGNFHYGVFGSAFGISDQILLRGAGWAQSNSGNKTDGDWYGSPPYGDDRKDQWWIQQGINYYNKVYR